MSKIHLNYNSLEKVLDIEDDCNSVILLTKRYYGIEFKLRECALFSTVIEHIIFEYTHEKIMLNCETDLHYIRDLLWFKNDDLNFYIKIFKFPQLQLKLCHIRTQFAEMQSVDVIGSDEFDIINTFMNTVYNKKNYIVSNIKSKYFSCLMEKNKITLKYNHKIIATQCIVKNYRKFTNLIVIIKCIVNGIKKYYNVKD